MDGSQPLLKAKARSTTLIRGLTAHRHTTVCLSLVVEPLSRASNPRSCQKYKKNAPLGRPFILAAPHGFEPRLTQSECAVLPLDDGAIIKNLSTSTTKHSKCQAFF